VREYGCKSDTNDEGENRRDKYLCSVKDHTLVTEY
jgi:hypothetical protein